MNQSVARKYSAGSDPVPLKTSCAAGKTGWIMALVVVVALLPSIAVAEDAASPREHLLRSAGHRDLAAVKMLLNKGLLSMPEARATWPSRACLRGSSADQVKTIRTKRAAIMTAPCNHDTWSPEEQIAQHQGVRGEESVSN
jgi:hypothetical protein